MQELRELRRMAGWTQAKASRASGINRAKLSQAECREVELSAEEDAKIRLVLLQAIRDRAERIKGVLTGANAMDRVPL
jgi:transcriptional regulator with XRE-family HTH domain